MSHYDLYLVHYGIKGMKWGIRKDKYKSMSRQERKAHRKKKRDEYRKMREYKSQLEDKAKESYDKKTNDAYRRSKENYETAQAVHEIAKKANKKYDNALTDIGEGISKNAENRTRKTYADESTKRDLEVGRKVSKEMTSKYGNEKVAEFNSYENKQAVKAVGAVLAGFGAMVIMHETVKR